MAKEKNAVKKLLDTCPQEISITSTGAPNPQFIYLDPAGIKHHAKVFWQALDLTQQYQISLPDPPAPLPFSNGNGPFLTDPNTGRTITLTVNSQLKPGGTVFSYSIDPAGPAQSPRIKRKRPAPGGGAGGIIIDG